MKVVSSQRGPKTAATVEDQRRGQIGVLSFDIAFNDSLAQMDRAGKMTLVVLAILANIDQDKLIAPIHARLHFIDICFAHSRFGVFDDLQETGWVLLSHRRNLPLNFTATARDFAGQVSRPFTLQELSSRKGRQATCKRCYEI